MDRSTVSVTPASMSYDDDDRLTGWNTLVTQSDADGNLTRGPLSGVLAMFVYDARNRLTSVGNSTFTYDAEYRRITRTVASTTTTFVHDPNAALSRLLQSTTGGTTTRYVYAGSLLLYAETGSSLRVHHFDYRGSTVALTYGTGVVLGRVTYGSYGEIVARTGNTATEFLYNGRDGVVTDPNGLYLMRARYYSPETRRFLNADPIGFAGGNNWYAYVGGSPVMFADPIGLCASDSAASEEATRMNLMQKGQAAFDELRRRDVLARGTGDTSCHAVNTSVLWALGPVPEGWSLEMERRGGRTLLGIPLNLDHWAAIARSPSGKEYLFDYWAPRPIGEDPATDFRSRYPEQLPFQNEAYVPNVPAAPQPNYAPYAIMDLYGFQSTHEPRHLVSGARY